jgi:uncharacterized caspase-like protein
MPVSESTKSEIVKWALIVGISEYSHKDWSLKYARRDAEELYDFLLSESGGKFQKDHILKLVDSKATTQNIVDALRNFLQQPGKEDLVLIYFACHGAPDWRKPNVLYLLTHDTNPRNIAVTALPMREIDSCIKDYLNAEKVIIIADACHSAPIGTDAGRRNLVNSTEAMNRYFEALSKSKGGLVSLTSALGDETAIEGEQWGGGHGVFTYYLLEGIRVKS